MLLIVLVCYLLGFEVFMYYYFLNIVLWMDIFLGMAGCVMIRDCRCGNLFSIGMLG